MWNWVFTLCLLSGIVSDGFAARAHAVENLNYRFINNYHFINQMKAAALYPGPLRIFVYDYDGNVGPIKGPGSGYIRVFLWNEPNTPFYDLAATDAPPPPYIDIPMVDWERGLPNEIANYRNVPLKHLIGTYVQEGRGIRNEGN
jgi:hypothetical protein